MIGLNAAPRSMRHFPINRKHNAGKINSFGYLRGGDTYHSPMPTVAGDHSYVRPGRLHFAVLQFGNCQLHDLLLNLLSFLVARVKMQSEPARLLVVSGAEEFDHGPGGIHPACGIDSWSKTKPDVISSQTRALSAASDFHQGPQAGVG